MQTQSVIRKAGMLQQKNQSQTVESLKTENFSELMKEANLSDFAKGRVLV